MIVTLFYILLFVAAVVGLSWGANKLINMDGGAQIIVGGQEANLTVFQMVLALLALAAAIYILIKLFGMLVALVRFLNGDETAMGRYFNRRNERRGLQALSDGVMALASGEGAVALAQAKKAERYLEAPKLTNLLKAQAAELSGDRRKATETYKELIKDESTRFVGVRGLMKQKLADGETDTAMKLAERAFALKPKHGETQDILLKLQADNGDWDGARKTLSAKLKSGNMPRDVHRRRDAVLALSSATDADDAADAKAGAIEANRLSPELIPAAVMAARGYIEKGDRRSATKVLKRAWDNKPHPDLAATFAEVEPNEDTADRIKRFKTFIRSNPDHPEARMLMAELHIAAEDFPEARRALGDLIESDPTARNLTIMAAIERGEGADEAVVRGWLTKALSAPRGPQWVCDNCGAVQDHWDPVCGSCGALDTLTWTRPNVKDVAMPASTELLPLMTAPKEEKAVAVVDPAEPIVDDAEVIEAEPAK